jgi:glycosyltransferase involved in cell wall biosynthesis
VHFLGARDDIYALLQTADVFALTSHMEGLPITLLEAMVSGVPIVATHVGGMVELVHGDGSDQDRCGITVAAHDTQAIAAAVENLLTKEEQRVAMGDNGRRRVAQAYTQRVMASRVETLYQEIVMKPSGL